MGGQERKGEEKEKGKKERGMCIPI